MNLHPDPHQDFFPDPHPHFFMRLRNTEADLSEA
jgi:hypothetical protein